MQSILVLANDRPILRAESPADCHRALDVYLTVPDAPHALAFRRVEPNDPALNAHCIFGLCKERAPYGPR